MLRRPPRPRPQYGPTIDAIVRRIRPAWMRDALCREHPEVSFFPELGESAEPAKSVCARCAVSVECLAYAIEHREDGVWGGTTARTRRSAATQEVAS